MCPAVPTIMDFIWLASYRKGLQGWKAEFGAVDGPANAFNSLWILSTSCEELQ
jgi:hypothetical protein